MQGYNFTERVRKALAMAREESVRLKHEYVGTEHILLGLIREGAGVAATVLQNLGVDPDELELKIEGVVKKGRSEPTGPDLPYTSRAKKVLELAMASARDLDHSYVGTEHLLLGLLREQKGIAAQVLIDSGVTLEKATVETVRILGSERPATDQETRVQHRAALHDGMVTAAQQLSDRIRDVMRDAESVATECGANQLMPVHVAIALVRNGEGLANAVLDRLGIDRQTSIGALLQEAKGDQTELVPGMRLEYGTYLIAFQRSVESESRWRQSPPTTLNILLALLDNDKPTAAIFQSQGITADRVRAEARRING